MFTTRSPRLSSAMPSSASRTCVSVTVWPRDQLALLASGAPPEDGPG